MADAVNIGAGSGPCGGGGKDGIPDHWDRVRRSSGHRGGEDAARARIGGCRRVNVGNGSTGGKGVQR